VSLLLFLSAISNVFSAAVLSMRESKLKCPFSARALTVTLSTHLHSGATTTGHAIVGALMPDYDMVQKITIIPRSNGAGGLTFFAPSEARLESGLYSRQYLEAQLAVALGGRLAEELIYGDDGVRL
jgi:Peptidase family M41